MRPIFDHLTLNARDALEPCCAALQAMGFALTPLSVQSIGSKNRCAIFEASYLEVIAIDHEALKPRVELMSQALGLNALVFRTEDAQACFAQLRAKGLPVLPVQSFSRPATDSLGREHLVSFQVVRFETAWAAEALPFGRVYFCQHLNPEVIFDAGFVKHPNQVHAFARIEVQVRDLQLLDESMRPIFGESWSRLSKGDVSSEREGFELDAQGARIAFKQGSLDQIADCRFALKQTASLTNSFINRFGRFSY